MEIALAIIVIFLFLWFLHLFDLDQMFKKSRSYLIVIVPILIISAVLANIWVWNNNIKSFNTDCETTTRLDLRGLEHGVLIESPAPVLYVSYYRKYKWWSANCDSLVCLEMPDLGIAVLLNEDYKEVDQLKSGN